MACPSPRGLGPVAKSRAMASISLRVNIRQACVRSVNPGVLCHRVDFEGQRTTKPGYRRPDMQHGLVERLPSFAFK